MKKLLLFLALLWTSPSWSAIAADGTASSTQVDNGTSCSFSHTVGSGSDRLLVLTYTDEDSSATDAAVANADFNGDAATHLVTVGTNNRTEQWYVLNPDSGTFTVTINFGGTVTAAACTAMSYTGVQQSGQPDATNSGTDAASVFQISIDTATENAWLTVTDYHPASAAALTASNLTERVQQVNNGAFIVAFGDRAATTTGTYTQGWSSGSGGTNQLTVVSWKPAVAGADNTVLQTIMIQ
jgi:hypothetical protein